MYTVPALSFTAPGEMSLLPSSTSSENDFDFLVGRWKVNNRKLNSRLNKCAEWTNFEAEGEMRKILGGIGNIYGAMIGGILLGIIESLGAGYIGDLTGGFLGSHYQDIFAFVVLIIVLTVRPSGIMGERVADRA